MLKSEFGTQLLEAQSSDDRATEAEIIKSNVSAGFASNQFSAKTMVMRFFEKIAYGASDCWYWIGAKNKAGYGVTSIAGESKSHRLAWKLFNKFIPEGMSVLHKCDVRCCVNPEHLFLGTQDENMKDCAAKGRIRSTPKHGEANPMSKLNEAKVLQIQKMLGRASQAEIARVFGVSPMTISRIANGKTWKGEAG